MVVRFFISIFVLYFTILHTIIIIVHLHGIFFYIFFVKLQLIMMQYGPPFFLKVGVQFCAPEIKMKDDRIPLSPLFSLAIQLLFS